jgi:two-component system, cell cycle sensor histidine kinase and response regulator CckA
MKASRFLRGPFIISSAALLLAIFGAGLLIERTLFDDVAPDRREHFLHLRSAILIGSAAGLVVLLLPRLLREATESRERHRAEQRQATQLAVTRVLAEAHTLPEAIPLLLQAICEGSGWDFGELWQVDGLASCLRWQCAWHKLPFPEAEEFAKASRDTTFGAGSGLPGRVWASGEPEWLSDAAGNVSFVRRRVAAYAGLHAALAFPVRNGSDVMGVLVFFCRTAGLPDEGLRRMMTDLGSLIGQYIARKRAEEALAQERSLVNMLMDTVPDGIYFKDSRCRFTRINKTVADRFGLADPAQALGRTDADFFTETFARQTLRDEAEVLRSGQALIGKEEKEVWPDGRESWASTTTVPLRNPEGQVIGLFGISRDITERKRAEEALARAEAKYRSIFENAVEGIYQTTVDGRFVTANPMLARIYGLPSAAELLATVSGSANHLYVEPGRRAEFMRLMQEQQALTGFESPIRRADGSLVWISENARTLQDASGHIVGYEGTVVDITARKRDEETLRQANETLRALIQAAPLAIISLDLQGILRSWNTAAERMFGWREEEVVGRPTPLVPADKEAEFRGFIDRLKRGETFAGVPAQRQRKDGSLIDVSLSAAPVCDAQGRITAIMALLADVTERKRLEEQLRQAQKMEAIGQLAGGVAHDFNNLLTAILGNVSLMLSGEPGGDRELLCETEQAALRAADLTRQLLGFSRQAMLRLEPTDLNASVQEVMAILRRTIDPRIRVEVNGSPSLWPVQADAGQMNQVLMNLGLNARDAMPNGGRLCLETANVVIEEDCARLHLEAHAGEHVRLRVRDTGHGIPPEIRPRIFDPFFTTKGPGRGTGLGLAMVFGIVKQHHGWIECASTVDQGTHFDIYLPRYDGALTPKATPRPAAPLGGSETLLLVDDEVIIRNLGRTILQRYGYRVLVATDGQEALEVYRREAPAIDLVILDQIMPRLSGRDTLRQLRQIDPQVRVLFSSGYSVEHFAGSGEHGVVGFVNKPYRPQDLAGTIRRVLDQVKGSTEARLS